MITPHISRRGNGGNVVFAGGRSRSISEDRLEELNWEGGQDTEEEEEDESEDE
jgi:hypothetical protein